MISGHKEFQCNLNLLARQKRQAGVENSLSKCISDSGALMKLWIWQWEMFRPSLFCKSEILLDLWGLPRCCSRCLPQTDSIPCSIAVPLVLSLDLHIAQVCVGGGITSISCGYFWLLKCFAILPNKLLLIIQLYSGLQSHPCLFGVVVRSCRL